MYNYQDKHWRALLSYCLEFNAYTGTQPPAITQENYDDVESLDGSQEPGNTSPCQRDTVIVDQPKLMTHGNVLNSLDTDNQYKLIPNSEKDTYVTKKEFANELNMHDCTVETIPADNHQELNATHHPEEIIEAFPLILDNNINIHSREVDEPCRISHQLVVANENVPDWPQSNATTRNITELAKDGDRHPHLSDSEPVLTTRIGEDGGVVKFNPNTNTPEKMNVGSSKQETLMNREEYENADLSSKNDSTMELNPHLLDVKEETARTFAHNNGAKRQKHHLSCSFSSSSSSSDLDDGEDILVLDEHDLDQGQSKGHTQASNYNGDVINGGQNMVPIEIRESDKAMIKQPAYNDAQLSWSSGTFSEPEVCDPDVSCNDTKNKTFTEEKGSTEKQITKEGCVKEIIESQRNVTISKDDIKQICDNDEPEIWDVDLSMVYQKPPKDVGDTRQNKLKEQWDNYPEEVVPEIKTEPSELFDADQEMPSLEDWSQDLQDNAVTLTTHEEHPKVVYECNQRPDYSMNKSVSRGLTSSIGDYSNRSPMPQGLGRGMFPSKSKPMAGIGQSERLATRSKHSCRSKMISAPTYNIPLRPSIQNSQHHMNHQQELTHQHSEAVNKPEVISPHEATVMGAHADCGHSQQDVDLNPEEVKGHQEVIPQQSSCQEDWTGSQNHFFYRKPTSYKRKGGRKSNGNESSWEETMQGNYKRYTSDEDFMGDYKFNRVSCLRPNGTCMTSYQVAENAETMDMYDVIIESSCDDSSDGQDRGGP